MRYEKPDLYNDAAQDYDRELHGLLDAAIDLPSGQLAPFLKNAASSPELALEAEILLRDPASQDDFLSPPVPGLVSWTATISAGASPAIQY